MGLIVAKLSTALKIPAISRKLFEYLTFTEKQKKQKLSAIFWRNQRLLAQQNALTVSTKIADLGVDNAGEHQLLQEAVPLHTRGD